MIRIAACALLVALGGCARRTDAATRRAWEKAARAADDPADDGGTDPDNPNRNGSGSSGAPAFGWDRVAQLLDEAVDVMRRSPDDQQMREIAARWCAEEADPQATPDGPVYACFPSPPVNVGESRFSVELGGPGVIGLVVRDVPGAEAQRLLTRAAELSQRLCEAPWKDVPKQPGDDGPPQQFRTCPVGGGPILAVGRFALDASADRWQVSVAIVGAS